MHKQKTQTKHFKKTSKTLPKGRWSTRFKNNFSNSSSRVFINIFQQKPKIFQQMTTKIKKKQIPQIISTKITQRWPFQAPKNTKPTNTFSRKHQYFATRSITSAQKRQMQHKNQKLTKPHKFFNQNPLKQKQHWPCTTNRTQNPQKKYKKTSIFSIKSMISAQIGYMKHQNTQTVL